MPTVQIRSADLHGLHVELAREEARQRHLELRVGEEEDLLAGELEAVAVDGLLRALDARRGDGPEAFRRHLPRARRGLQPLRGALGAEREGRRDPLRAAPLECLRRVGEERLCQQEMRAGADRRQVARESRRQEAHVLDAERRERAAPLVLDHVGERAHHQHLLRGARGLRRHAWDERGEAGVLALRERGLDAAARIVEHAHARRERLRESLRGPRQVELDHLGRAGADQEQQLDVGPALEQARDHAVELCVGVGETGEVAVVDDRGGEARLGEDHHAGRRLDQVRAGARADHEEECVLDLAVQPDDAGEPAEHLALAALAQDRKVRTARIVPDRKRALFAHSANLAPAGGSSMVRCSASSRAARSFSTNCVAFRA